MWVAAMLALEVWVGDVPLTTWDRIATSQVLTSTQKFCLPLRNVDNDGVGGSKPKCQSFYPDGSVLRVDARVNELISDNVLTSKLDHLIP